MEDKVYLFLGAISDNRMFILLGHVILVFIIILILGILATRKMKIVPTGLQNIFESYLAGIVMLSDDVVGKEHTKRYLPLVATIGLLIFVANVIGIIPGFVAPSSYLDFTIAFAVVVFIYYNYEGIRVNGVFKYFKHFLGPVWWLSWLMFPIEIISNISRMVSLSFRLFGNIKGDDLFLIVMLMLAPYVVPPLIAYGFLGIMAVLQAFVFVILTLVYISSAIELEEH